MDSNYIAELVDILYDVGIVEVAVTLKKWVICKVSLIYNEVESLEDIYESIFGFDSPCKETQDAVKYALDILENRNVYRRYYEMATDPNVMEALEATIEEAGSRYLY